MTNKTIYRLSVADVQQVATEVYGRKLTAAEIEKVVEPMGTMISWYDIIDDAIDYSLDLKRVVEN